MDKERALELLRVKENGYLFHRESQEVEFKEQFNLAGLAEYFRDFAAFANNQGGYLIFGVQDSPRVRIGLSDQSKEQFEKVDPEKVSGFLLEIFSSEIVWEQNDITIGKKTFGLFRIHEADTKPVIARKNEGKEQTIKNGDIYYRYGGRTQKIQSAELEAIINKRIQSNNQNWIDLVQKIGAAGPQNAAILDTEKSLIQKNDSQILVMDEALASKLKFIKEGNFDEKKGAKTLKLVGDVIPIDRVEVVKHVKGNLLKDYPLSAMDLSKEVRKQLPNAKQNRIWEIIRENGLKTNENYASYNFRNKKQEELFKATGDPGSNPTIYKQAAVGFIVNVLRDESVN
jgi:predicted HTH transcriptional regulator